MAYVFINSFKKGIDARRSRISAQQGSLVSGNNVHINRGGEIEKRKAFVPIANLPAGKTFGLHSTRFGIYVFGSEPPEYFTLPARVIYQQLIAPGAPYMTEVIGVDSFNSAPYVVARFNDGSVHHFYNGSRVTDWDVLSPGISNLATLCSSLAELVDTDPQVAATYSLVGGVHTITVTSSANNVSPFIGARVQNISGRLINTATIAVTQAATVGLPQIVKIQISGLDVATNKPSQEVEAADVWMIGVDLQTYRLSGGTSGIGGTVRTFRGKVYTTIQGLLYFSDTQKPERWTTTYTSPEGKKIDTFAGFESLSAQTGGTENLTALAPYQNFLAIFARRATQIWQVVPGDPVDNQPQQILENIGTYAPRSAMSFGELDVFFLSDSGIRSLRARDASNSAVVFDVGTSIDPIVVKHVQDVGEAVALKACGVIEPRDGRYMLAIGDKIFVYSFFPASQISAWTTYEPGFSVSDFAVSGNSLFCRAGDTVFAYGGESGNEYDDTLCEVELSWLDGEKPAHRKSFKGIDISCNGTWRVDYSTDPNTFDYSHAGSVIGQNFSLPHFRLSSNGTHIGLKFSSSDVGAVGISSVCAHFEFAEPPR